MRASILQWGGTDADADAYLAKPGVAYVAGATGLKQIGLQKWISMFTQGNEAWAEWRRTGNPATVKMGPKAYPDVPEIPRRILYPSNEQTVNAATPVGGGHAPGCRTPTSRASGGTSRLAQLLRIEASGALRVDRSAPLLF